MLGLLGRDHKPPPFKRKGDKEMADETKPTDTTPKEVKPAFVTPKEPPRPRKPVGPTARDHFDSEAEFSLVLSQAEQYAQGDFEEHFVNAVAQRATQWGFEANLTAQEAFKLRKISEKED